MNDLKRLKSIKYLIILTIPIFIEYLLQLLVGYSDQFMISKYSASGVSAIGNSNTILNVFIYTITVLSQASIILITQFKGANLKKKENAVYSISFFFNLFVGLIISALLIVLARPIFIALKIPEESMNEAILYLRIVGGGFILTSIMLILSSFLKSNSLMYWTMIINVIINIINIGGNAILIPRLGVMGAAISSISSRIIACILLFIVYFVKIKVKFTFKAYKENPGLFKKLIVIGLPSAGESFSYNFSQIIIQAIINPFGLMVSNTKFYVSMIASITYMSSNAFSSSMQVIEGEMLGMGCKKEAKIEVLRVLVISVISLTTLATLFYFISDPLLGIFTKDEFILSLGKKVLLVDIFLELGRAFNIVFVHALQTAGDVIFPTILSVIFCWLVAVLMSYILSTPCNLGLIGVWIAMALDECFRAIIFSFRFIKGKWMKNDLIKDH